MKEIPMMSVKPVLLRSALRAGFGAAALALSAAAAHAQAASNPAAHPAVCAEGVRTYESIKDVPVPHDSVVVPPASAPVVVTNPDEAEAARMAMMGRAGSAGATGVVVTIVDKDDGNGRVMSRRTIQGFFVPSDSARAQAACRK
jgi:hypothetical protein